MRAREAARGRGGDPARLLRGHPYKKAYRGYCSSNDSSGCLSNTASGNRFEISEAISSWERVGGTWVATRVLAAMYFERTRAWIPA